MSRNFSQSRRAFTLLELLISLALVAVLFVALNQFIFSMGELWGQGAQRRLFERHASMVAQHLQSMLQSAASRTGDNPPATVSDSLAGQGGGALVTFELPNGDRVFPWPEHALPEVVCAVQAQPGRGLMLRWISRLEPGFANGSVRTVILSAYSQGIEYEYLDRTTHSWNTSPSLQRDAEGKWLLPTRLRVRFVRDNLKTERTVFVPVHGNALPAF